jgi:hypothetical protein
VIENAGCAEMITQRAASKKANLAVGLLQGVAVDY